jgi:hypothetical protein
MYVVSNTEGDINSSTPVIYVDSTQPIISNKHSSLAESSYFIKVRFYHLGVNLLELCFGMPVEELPNFRDTQHPTDEDFLHMYHA